MSGGGAEGEHGGRGGTTRRATPRSVAYEVLGAVSSSDAYANLLLPGRIRRSGFSSAEAALTTELCYGTLRMQGYYDRVIALASGRPLEKIDAPVLDALRLGVHQLLGMRTASHAAVNETVALVRSSPVRSAAPFANAVLRAVARETPEVWADRVEGAARNADDRLATRHSHPTWVVRALKQALAAEGAGDELEALLEADNAAPRVNLVALPGLAVLDELGTDAVADRFSPVGATSAGGDPDAVPAVASGRARVQDEGSQLVALALSRLHPVAAGERWLDLCAGPGGKAALLAAEARLGGASFTANELVPARAGLVRQALERVAPETTVWNVDGTTVGETHPGSFDRILLDAPCSGLGALRRRPEARWRKTKADVAELAELQAALFDSAVAALAPGGVLAYVTCSPHLAETRAVLDAALERHEGVVASVDTHGALDAVALAPLGLRGHSSSAQLWPHRHGTDAMFIALVRKRAAPPLVE